MPDIEQEFPVAASPAAVIAAVTTPAGLDAWWTLRSSGTPTPGARYTLHFGPGYDWVATVRTWVPEREIEWEFTTADADWTGTCVGLRLEPRAGGTQVCFRHTGWRTTNRHYRITSHCWALYLRLLRRYVERGEIVPYDDRLDA